MFDMTFDLDNLNPAITMFFDDEKPEKGSVDLRPCNGDALLDIQKKTTKKRVEYKKGQRYEFLDTDPQKQEEEIWDYSIVNWDIKDKGKNAIPCTAENKIKLMRGSIVFANHIKKSMVKVNAMFEDPTKN